MDLGGHSQQDWVSAFRTALEYIHQGVPTWAAELPWTLQRLLPVGFEEAWEEFELPGRQPIPPAPTAAARPGSNMNCLQ